ncbi:mhck/ef2 kinase domain protein (macronuclear) [Tetrahymena thermophila SB210]|uniref:Mhck/ef2 kinase domain protein n=1 Tax=Tetrahymena thermophila (strain SB210) TaxID=312017 RepID=Q24CC6_TETTS|nr:mhck/ef2 kinase domain protein [Tetrahymena thermophila SB210]EAS05448.1 mhck/ef2 kinase domain protein [Tetrahymena thermophila SB210]|eukprot:XP_001025693.1 mhck/ef2 kinase domain protein [Tetrahymena thermophila SB210]
MKTAIEEKKLANQIYQTTLKNLANDVLTYNSYMYSMLPKSELDLMFIVDCTGSMGSWITAVKNEIFAIVKQIKQQFKTSCIRLCFCGYRDIQDAKIRFSIFPFSTNWRQFKKFVSGVSAAGGGDEPEDVFGGFKSSLEQDWASGARYAVFIADAPAHGKDYNDCGSGDNYPNGDPSGEDLEHFMQIFAQKKIKLYSARINSSTDKMMKKLSQEYQKYAGVEIQQGELGNSVKEFGKFIVKTALETLIKNQEEEGVQQIDTSKLYYKVVYNMLNNIQFNKSNFDFKIKYDEIMAINKSFRDQDGARDEETEINEYQVKNQKSSSLFSLQGIKDKLESLILNDDKASSSTCVQANRYDFSIQKDSDYQNIVRWDKPLHICKTKKEVNLSIEGIPFAKGNTNYVFKLKEDREERVGKIPIKVKRSQKDDLEYYINLNKDIIIAQQIYEKEKFVDFCIYEVEINNKKLFFSSQPFQKDLNNYNKFASFQEIGYDSDGINKQFVGHQSYQRTYGYYMIANYYQSPNNSKIFKPLVYSLDPKVLLTLQNQSYLGIFKYFINHTCTEKCTQENDLIDLEDFTDPEKLNFKLPEPIE